jgi:hypothetical protein
VQFRPFHTCRVDMFSFLGQGVLGELLAPTKTPGQQLHQAIEDGLNEKVRGCWCAGVTRGCLVVCFDPWLGVHAGHAPYSR